MTTINTRLLLDTDDDTAQRRGYVPVNVSPVVDRDEHGNVFVQVHLEFTAQLVLHAGDNAALRTSLNQQLRELVQTVNASDPRWLRRTGAYTFERRPRPPVAPPITIFDVINDDTFLADKD